MALESKSKLFVSYSRRDLEFTNQLVAGLEATGSFHLLIDRDGIGHGEDWKARLCSLILECDTMVFVLSPDSVASDVCAWEVEEALRLSKRIIPILWRSIDFARAPRGLSAINAVPFDNERAVTGLTKLVSALQSDLDWLREHTRLSERAAEWEGSGRTPELLLRGSALRSVQEWLTARPVSAPDATRLQRSYIQASEEEETRILSSEHLRAAELEAAKGIAEAERDAAKAAHHNERAAAYRARILAVAALGLLLVAAGAALYAYRNEQIARSQSVSAQLSSLQARAEQNFARANFHTLLASRTGELSPRPDQNVYLGRLEQNAAEFRGRGNTLLQEAFSLAALPADQQIAVLNAPKASPTGIKTFTVEPLQVRHGTALLIRFGINEAQNTILYGGGPVSAFTSSLLPALRPEVEHSRKRLRFELVILPQQDDEYLGGVNRLLNWLNEARQHGEPLPLELGGVWHNSFAPLSPVEDVERATVPQRASKDYAALAARSLGIPVNEPFDYFVSAARDGPARVHLESGMRITVMGPTPEDLEALHKDWRRNVGARLNGEQFTGQLMSLVDQIGGFVEGYSSPHIELIRAPDIQTETGELDRSVVNLSSMLLLLEFGGRSLLLCGDANGGQIVRGLISAGLLQKGNHALFDAILLPHSDSARNISKDFFRQVHANHYIVSGDGRFGPNRETIQMLIDARGDEGYQIHFNHSIDQLDAGRKEDWRKQQARQEGRRRSDPSVTAQADWSPEHQGLAALLAQHEHLSAGDVGSNVDGPPIIDLTK